MKIVQIILFSLSALSGCSKQAQVPPAGGATKTDTTVSKPVMSTDSITYLALGDSYTIGQSVQPAQSFPYQLKSALLTQSYTLATPNLIATTGWTTDDLIAGIAEANITGKTYDVVTLLIGVNDQYQNLSQSNYSIKFAQVLNEAITFAKGDPTRVFVLSIPDYGVTPFGAGQDSVIGPLIDQFNTINKGISLKAGVNYLDITGISREAATNPALIASDGLHPSAQMYSLWIDVLAPLVATRLAEK